MCYSKADNQYTADMNQCGCRFRSPNVTQLSEVNRLVACSGKKERIGSINLGTKLISSERCISFSLTPNDINYFSIQISDFVRFLRNFFN